MKSTNALLIIFLTLFSFLTIAQTNNVGIGTLNPDNSAVLELSSANKGLLITRVTTAQRLAIASPARGLLVYDLDSILSEKKIKCGRLLPPFFIA